MANELRIYDDQGGLYNYFKLTEKEAELVLAAKLVERDKAGNFGAVHSAKYASRKIAKILGREYDSLPPAVRISVG